MLGFAEFVELSCAAWIIVFIGVVMKGFVKIRGSIRSLEGEISIFWGVADNSIDSDSENEFKNDTMPSKEKRAMLRDMAKVGVTLPQMKTEKGNIVNIKLMQVGK